MKGRKAEEQRSRGARRQGRTRNPKPETSNSELTYGFTVAAYDKTKDLIIAPLLASTFLGGSDGDYGVSLTLDTSGNVYVTGYTVSPNFPTTSGAYDTSFNGGSDVFVSKLDGNLSDGTAQPHMNNLSSYLWAPGTAVTINGVNFGNTQGVVNFGATTASVTSWNDTSTVISVPELPPETYSISVTTGGQTSNGLSFLLTEAQSDGDFGIEVKPPTQMVAKGSSALYSVFIKSINGFNEPVTLQVDRLPQGASASFQRNPV